MNTNAETARPPDVKGGSPSTPSLETLIKKHPFLEGMSPHQLRLLSDCAMLSRFEAGEVIFREGDPANRFYLLQTGKVALESFVEGRGGVRVRTIGAGEALGWSWLFPPYYWHFGARALEPTEAIFIYGTPLREECEFDHDLGYELFKRMAAVMLERLQAARRQSLRLAGTQPKGP